MDGKKTTGRPRMIGCLMNRTSGNIKLRRSWRKVEMPMHGDVGVPDLLDGRELEDEEDDESVRCRDTCSVRLLRRTQFDV